MKISKRIRAIIILAISMAISAYFIPWGILSLALYPLPDTVQEEIDRMGKHGLDGTIVYVDKASQVSNYAAGWKNRQAMIEAKPDDLFKIASISKLFIASAAAMMIDEGQLKLEEKLTSYLPHYGGQIEYADSITLRMLIGHRSGIPNYTDHPEFPWESPPKSNSEALALVLGMPGDFAPGKDYKYSNTNYLLLGEIMDTTLGYSHHRYIKEKILEPLGLKHTYSLLSQVDMDEVMSGYYVGYEPDIKYNDFISPGGSMVSTAEEVGIFLRALNEGSLLTGEAQEIYTEIYAYNHTGLLPGYQSIAKYHPESDTVVVLFNNTSGGLSWSKTEILYKRLLRILDKQN